MIFPAAGEAVGLFIRMISMGVREEMSDRWKMNRIGFVNFWLYDEEDFEFVDGKLSAERSKWFRKISLLRRVLSHLYWMEVLRTRSRLDLIWRQRSKNGILLFR